METLAQKWSKEGVEKGIVKSSEKDFVQGIVRGIVHGIVHGMEKGVEAQRQTLLRLAKWRFTLPADAEQRYAQQLAQIHNLAHLLQLVDQVLLTEDVAEFDKALLAYLPPTGASQ
ncbi:MAG: hypothetical protein ACOYNY_40145 [Caldilineaceae bacterium]